MTTTHYAGFWKRVGAVLIDGIVLMIVGNIINMLLPGQAGGSLAGVATTVKTSSPSASLIIFVLNWLYFSYFESSDKQATPGKMALGIIVADTNGKRLSFLHATGRWAAKFLSMITLGIGYVMAAFTQKKQALHDMVAGTLVVNK